MNERVNPSSYPQTQPIAVRLLSLGSNQGFVFSFLLSPRRTWRVVGAACRTPIPAMSGTLVRFEFVFVNLRALRSMLDVQEGKNEACYCVLIYCIGRVMFSCTDAVFFLSFSKRRTGSGDWSGAIEHCIGVVRNTQSCWCLRPLSKPFTSKIHRDGS